MSIRFSTQTFDPTPWTDNPTGDNLFGKPDAEEIADAERSFRKRQGELAVAVTALLTLVPRNAEGYVVALDTGSDNATCNAARMLYRQQDPKIREWLDRAMRARFPEIHWDESPAGWLRLVWDFGRREYRPIEGTDWSDQNFQHGPARQDVAA